MMNKPEILAPAGSFDSLTAAVRCGADAVYLGGRELNARRNAANFSNKELAQAVEYCHARGVKVYITLNTLVRDDEMETAMNAVRCACDNQSRRTYFTGYRAHFAHSQGGSRYASARLDTDFRADPRRNKNARGHGLLPRGAAEGAL